MLHSIFAVIYGNIDVTAWIQVVETAGIKFPDFKGSGVSLRSQRMKLPASVGQKRTKAIEQLLQELSIGIVAKYFCQNNIKHE